MSAIIEAARTALYAEMQVASAALKTFPRASNGLTSDAIKFSPEYRTAKTAYDRSFQAVRAFNANHPR